MPMFSQTASSRIGLCRGSGVTPPARLAALLVCSAAFVSAPGVAPSQGTGPTAPAQMSSSDIVARMLLHDRMQNKNLEQYHTMRHYAVEYQGFPHSLSATMEVELSYDAATGKSFHIVSQSGSRLLLERVLKRAVTSETEAANTRQAAALTPDNYRFELAGGDTINGRAAYVLHVDPLQQGKFLYKGKIWVDSTDFALEKVEAEPAKNPSLWISETEIHQTYAPEEGFWLPLRNRSETKVRLGGKAVLTIDYGPYLQVTGQPLTPVLATGRDSKP